MSFRAFRPTNARVQNASKIINGTRTNATIRDLEEEEGELEEKEGTVVSIKRDLINGAGWTVKDTEGNEYICSCASSMYELPETIERGGILYPAETITVTFTVNPVLHINTIKEITSLGEETDKIDISKWQHGDAATTVIAKPRSALSISDGFITMNYDNNNQVIADENAVTTEGEKTNINTNELNINSPNVKVQGQSLMEMIAKEATEISNEYSTYNIDNTDGIFIKISKSNNIMQSDIYTENFQGYQEDNDGKKSTVIGEIKDQKLIPMYVQSQQLITDGNCVDMVTIDDNGIIYIHPFQRECDSIKNITSVNNWITPQTALRNYIKVIVKETCNYCDEGNNTKAEYINYCPSCKNFNALIDTPTSIKCNFCNSQYCQNCGTNLSKPSEKLKTYKDNYISAIGTTCQFCKEQLSPNTNKQYVNYCPDCEQWGWLRQSEMEQNNEIINILECGYCNSKFCNTCGIDQDRFGLKKEEMPNTYTKYSNALRKLKYIRDGA